MSNLLTLHNNNCKVSLYLSMSECKSSSHRFIAADQSKVATLPRVSSLTTPHNQRWIHYRDIEIKIFFVS